MRSSFRRVPKLSIEGRPPIDLARLSAEASRGGELRPRTCSGAPFDLIKLPLVTLVDTLDTLAILGNRTEVQAAVQRIWRNLAASRFPRAAGLLSKCPDISPGRELYRAQLKAEKDSRAGAVHAADGGVVAGCARESDRR